MSRETPYDPAASSAGEQAEHPRLDWHLENWARYQRAGGTRQLGTKTQSHWASGSSDFETMADKSEMRHALAVDALVWDLPDIERVAIMHTHLNAVWRSNREAMQEVYGRARLSLSAAMLRRAIP